ncbi:MAG: Response regulator rcp1 [Candidatus Omnitrophica bacterium]|nr:Response regulator rcp1 [Candidatus Omnitrophota bacterium]
MNGQTPDTARILDILLAEDNEADVKIALRAFEKAGLKHVIHVVRDGQEALDFLRQTGRHSQAPRPDVVLLDIQMPKLTGLQVLEEMKRDPELRRIPAVMLTSSRNEGDIRTSYSSYASGFMQKPIAFEDFEKLVEGFNRYWAEISRLPKKGS